MNSSIKIGVFLAICIFSAIAHEQGKCRTFEGLPSKQFSMDEVAGQWSRQAYWFLGSEGREGDFGRSDCVKDDFVQHENPYIYDIITWSMLNGTQENVNMTLEFIRDTAIYYFGPYPGLDIYFDKAGDQEVGWRIDYTCLNLDGFEYGLIALHTRPRFVTEEKVAYLTGLCEDLIKDYFKTPENLITRKKVDQKDCDMIY